ncbi:MAG: hypothetical protein U0414_38355 [Polyangiaceae bacterium]
MNGSSAPSGSLRGLILALLGVPAASLTALSCGRGTPQVPLPDDEVVRQDMPNAMWSVELAHPEPQEYPSCPGGSFCLVGSGGKATAPATAPFDNCEATVEYPGDPSSPMAQRGLSVSFSDFWTRNERKAKSSATVCCYSWFEPCPGGRPLRASGGAPLFARVAATRAPSSLVDPERARHWADMARSEHASIASFARFALELLALGAPASLVARAHRAALDEITHTELAVRLVERFGGGRLELGALDVGAAGALSSSAPAEVLRGTVRDGCVAETRAALDAAARASASTDPAERAAFEQIAADESMHASLAFDAVDWIVGRFGPDLATIAIEAARVA